MIRFLQSNLNHCRGAQDLLSQAVVERRVDVAIISEPHSGTITGSPSWLLDSTGRAALGVINNRLTVGDVEVGDGYVAARIDGTSVYSCYASPNSPIASYRAFLLRIEDSVRRRQGDVIVAGDFNAKSAAWNCTTTDTRGEELSASADALRLEVANVGAEPTFHGRGAGSVVDVTLVSESLIQRTSRWRVLTGVENMSDHRYIEFEIGRRPGGVEVPRASGRRGWITTKIDDDLVMAGLLLAEWTKSSGPNWGPEEAAVELERGVTMACDLALQQKLPLPQGKRPVHWWNDEISSARRECVRLRRVLTRARARAPGVDATAEHDDLRGARKRLNTLIRRSKEKCWADLTKMVDDDPWGKPYKVVMRKLQGPPAVNRLEHQVLAEVVDGLFPQHPPLDIAQTDEDGSLVMEDFTQEEVDAAVDRFRRRNKAPGPDCIPSKMWGAIHAVCPSLLTGMYNSCLRAGKFPARWKTARLVLLRKGQKPEGVPSSYRPLCLLNDVGKIMEELLARRIGEHVRLTGGIADGQYGFCRGRSTEDAVKRMESLVIPPCNRQEFCVAVSLDIKNAFNSVGWRKILGALEELQMPPYLRRMVRSYFDGRTIECDTPSGPMRRDVTSGVPQGSVLGPLLWNIAFDGVLRVPTPPGTNVICFADDTLMVAEGKTIPELEVRANEAVETVTRWIEQAGLCLSVEKTEAVLFTHRYKYTPPRILLKGEELDLGKTMKYLGLVIDDRLMYGPHLKNAASKAQGILASLGRLMPNLGGPKQSRRRLLVSVVHSVLLYGAPVWRRTLKYAPRNVAEIQKVQRRAALRSVCGYKTVSHVAANILSGLPPIEHLAKERESAFETRRSEGRPASVKEKADYRRKTMARWKRQVSESEKGEWTRTLIPDLERWVGRAHGEMTYRLTQMMSGHGCFNKFLHRIGKAPTPACAHCSDQEDDDAAHTLLRCEAWREQRRALQEKVGQVDQGSLVGKMLQSPQHWKAVEEFAEEVMAEKEEAERQRQQLPPL